MIPPRHYPIVGAAIGFAIAVTLAYVSGAALVLGFISSATEPLEWIFATVIFPGVLGAFVGASLGQSLRPDVGDHDPPSNGEL